MPATPLQEKVAIVTGAGSDIGLGRAMALAMVAAGARVTMMDIDPAALARVAAEALEIGGPGSVIQVVGDVASADDAERTVERTLAELGGLHILVNNAGTNPRNAGFTEGQPAFWDLPPAAWFRVAAVNYVGPILMARAVVPHLLRQGWGRIIGVTTSLDTMLARGNPAYGSTKAGHEAFMASIAQELAGTGVTVNILVPGGAANTNMIPRDTPRDRAQLIQPEVMQAPIIWLCSAAADSFHGKRVIAAAWDPEGAIDVNLARSSAPLAWPQLGRPATRRPT